LYINAKTKKINKIIEFLQKYTISYKNKIKEKWDILIIFFAISNSFLIPIQIVFEPPFLEK